MISKEEEQYILKMAYVPEHIVSLMTIISKAEPLLVDHHLIYAKDDWAILVGYPLDGNFSGSRLHPLVHLICERYTIRYLWVIAPEIPGDLAGTPSEREHDNYYRLDLADFSVRGNIKRAVKKAQLHLLVEKAATVSKEHTALIKEFLKYAQPNAMIRELFLGTAEYVNGSDTAFVLEARDHAGILTAFFVIDTAADRFDTYVVGCHSKSNYVPYASDLLFANMVLLAQERKKAFINLGLGVNSGIRRFKEKWGGVPFLGYEYCEYTFGPKRTFSIIDAITSKL
jgi:hypothetical protein